MGEREFAQKITKVTKGFGIGRPAASFAEFLRLRSRREIQPKSHSQMGERKFSQKITKVTKGFGIGQPARLSVISSFKVAREIQPKSHSQMGEREFSRKATKITKGICIGLWATSFGELLLKPHRTAGLLG
jgi:hypothetical protein